MAIYFIVDEHHRAVKIGYSYEGDARRRIAALQTANVSVLLLLGVNPAGRLEHERVIHNLLNPYRLRGEWFDFSAEEVKNYCLRCIEGWLPDAGPLSPERDRFGNIRCPKCRGDGHIPDSRFCGSGRACPTCSGDGHIDYRRVRCYRCDGIGFVPSDLCPKQDIPRMITCPKCEGRCWHLRDCEPEIDPADLVGDFFEMAGLNPNERVRLKVEHVKSGDRR